MNASLLELLGFTQLALWHAFAVFLSMASIHINECDLMPIVSVDLNRLGIHIDQRRFRARFSHSFV